MEKVEIKYTKFFINNEFVEGEAKTTIPVINPSTEEVICEISEPTKPDVEKAVQAAKTAWKSWKKVNQEEKAKCLFKLADLVDKNADYLTKLECLDNGKCVSEAQGDISDVSACFRYYAGWADKVDGRNIGAWDNMTMSTRKEPYGVVGCISPWNYPLLMATWKMAPCLAAGNCMVMKCSEVTPLSCLFFCSLIVEAGFPPGVLNMLPGYGHITGEAITRHPDVRKVSFTGSSLVGRKVLQASSESNLKKTCLELGGKSPMIVFDDANIDKAVEESWSGCFFNMSQNCVASTRIYVQDTIYDKFCDKMAKRTEEVKIGSPFEKDVNFGPLINKMQFEKVLGFIDHAKSTGLECIAGGSRKGTKGYFVNPTIYKNVPQDHKLAKEEIFGPVLCIMKPFKTIDEALELANDTPYGLGAGCFTNDMNKAERCIRELEAGTIFVNNYNLCLVQLEFGGYKQSGFGKDNGAQGISEYLQTKAVYQKFDF